MNINEGYAFADVQPFVVLALRLLFTECVEEILDAAESQYRVAPNDQALADAFPAAPR